MQGRCQITGSKKRYKDIVNKQNLVSEGEQQNTVELKQVSSSRITKLVPANFHFKFVIFLSELLNAFEMHLLLRVQALVLFRVRVFLLADQMLKKHTNACASRSVGKTQLLQIITSDFIPEAFSYTDMLVTVHM